MRRNDATGRLSLVGAATAFCACSGRALRRSLRCGALAALAVSNPALEASKVDAALLVDAGVAASRTSAASILAAQPATSASATSRSSPRSMHSPQECADGPGPCWSAWQSTVRRATGIEHAQRRRPIAWRTTAPKF